MTFFIDLWQDLREKRLWPVAVGLVAAIAAIPLVLFKPAGKPEEPAAPAVASTVKTGSVLPAVSVSSGPAQGSRLDTFTQKNPFKPLKDLDKASAATATPAASAPATTKPAALAKVAAGAAKSAVKLTGGSSGGSSSPAATNVGGGTPSAPSVQSHTTTTSWTYAASFSFGAVDKMKTLKDVKPFTLLPDSATPAIVFAGADAKHAVFYIQDRSYVPQGEGKCNAPGDKCQFVTLTTADSGNEEAFVSADGTSEYDVKLLSLKRKTLDQTGGGSSSSKGKAVSGAAAAKVADESILPVLFGFSSTTVTKKTK